MQFITMILSLIGFLTLAHATAIATGSGLPYAVEPFQYSGTLGGCEVQLNGTVQEIYARMQELYPDFNPELAARSNDMNLEPRAASNKDGLLCCPVAGQPWTEAYKFAILNGIGYLNGMGRCGVPATSCVRISCSIDSAIYLCNDNDYYIEPACVYLATYAQDLVNDCGYFDFWANQWVVCGQEFDSDRYNIIVRDDTC